MFPKVRLIAILTILTALLLTACGGAEEEPAPTEAPAATEVPAKPAVKAALVLPGPLGDRSFLDSADRGMEWAQEQLGADITVIEGNFDASEYETSLRAMAEAGNDVVISVGFRMVDATNNVAAIYPDTNFAIVDNTVDQPNVASLLFREHEGSFLVGVIAGSMTRTNVIGFVGGLEIPLIRRFQVGFEEGVLAVNPDAEIVIGYVGAFNDPTKGKELALSQYENGADIIFAAAGKSGEGVIAASAETGNFSIGVDSNQDYIAPGNVITSMMKKVDKAVLTITEDAAAGNFAGGPRSFGVSENMVGPTWTVEPDGDSTFRENGPEDMVAKMDEVIALVKDYAAKIISGEVVVTDVYEEQ